MSTNEPPSELSDQDVAAALKQARARGLPDGWTVKLDKRRRRKWVSPNGRSCDSIPKALAISKKLGLLPADFPIESTAPSKKPVKKPPTKKPPSKKPPSKKRPASSTAAASSVPPAKKVATAAAVVEKVPPPRPPPPPPPPVPDVDPGPESDPEDSFDVSKKPGEWSTRPTTVHWDPDSPDGRKIGWRIRLWDPKGHEWKQGRILLYDPYSHKHKIRYDDENEARRDDDIDDDNCVWLLLANEVVRCATKFVWAHVKGFAWWPAQVMGCDPPTPGGRLLVEFFSTNEIATLRDSPDSIRPFDDGKVDAVVAKNKKKRSAKAVLLACQEQITTQEIRNQAARFYAEKAFAFVNKVSMNVLGKRVEVHRSDVNYPYGDTVTGTVRKYSTATKKWLISYEMSSKTKNRYEPSWVNLQARECAYKVIDKETSHSPTDEDLVPFMHGFVHVKSKSDESESSSDAAMAQLLSERCRGCVEHIAGRKTGTVTCNRCFGSFHQGCVDTSINAKTVQKVSEMDEGWVCSKCTTCRGCLQQDVAFGSHARPPPSTLSLAAGDQLLLCSMCTNFYDSEGFCPNCAHIWDDVRYQKVQRRVRWNSKRRQSPKGKARKRKRDDKAEDSETAKPSPSEPSETATASEEVASSDSAPDQSWYYPETTVWGYTEGSMLVCDGCNLWVHAGCASLARDEYEDATAGTHPIYGKEFLCRVCCKRRCQQIIQALQEEDVMFLFAVPVTEQMAPNYHDVIKNPMDLQTMSERCEQGDYPNYAWVREAFELMVLNALTFNHPYSKYWNEARRFHHECMRRIFSTVGRAAPPGMYSEALEKSYEQAERAKELEIERVQQDKTAEKKDLVAGSGVASVTLPALRDKPIDPASCVPFTEVQLKPLDAYYCAWMDCCFTCGSSGASDTMLFCVDCGEAFHSFCVGAPVHSMDRSSVAGWRCPNCKICEISCDVPQDELMMLVCEMCDRGFSLDLLDPPLKSAPSGLWICGQCVDCKTCGNTSEPRGVSLKYWSRDAQKCFRCGGCKGLIEKSTKGMRCLVCSKLSREDDEGLVECASCNTRIHASCDGTANEFLRKKHTPSRRSAKGDEENKYECPSCRKKKGGDLAQGKLLRRHLRDQAWLVILQGTLFPHANYSVVELHEKLAEEIDWRIRSMWREEYRALVKEGLRVLAMAKSKLGSTNAIMDRFLEGKLDLPSWMGQRAARFIRRAKHSRWDMVGFQSKDIGSLVLMAKLAASFLKVACRAMGINTKKNVKYYNRLVMLLKAPYSCGLMDLPSDAVRYEGNRAIIQEQEWKTKVDPQLKMSAPEAPKKKAEVASRDEETAKDKSVDDNQNFIIASPMRGWNNKIRASDSLHQWKDPRSCCLCRTCGDDDAGFPPNDSYQVVEETSDNGSAPTSNEPDVSRVGRLLSMSDGLWVHASCALWSSEVWEAAAGGLIHAMDKARSRGSQLKCFGCGRPGATLGCFKANCSSNYHFPCAKACGAAFTSKRQMFCANHRSHAKDLIDCESFEHMTTLKVATEKEQGEGYEANMCVRVGSLVVHSLGTINQKRDGFHSEDYITPPGYLATRIFWSSRAPKTRTVYVLKIDQTGQGNPVFSITPGDDPSARIRGRSVEEVYRTLINRVNETNRDQFSHNDMFSKLPMVRRTERTIYGLNGSQFFGFGLNNIRRALESSSGVEAVVAPLVESSPAYRFCFVQPSIEAVMALQRKRAAVAAEKALENASGCARTEGMRAVARSGGSGRITRVLVRSVEEEAPPTSGASGRRTVQEESKTDKDSNQNKYRDMKSVPMEQRLVARRSHIHGWGLFSKVDLPKHSVIAEYMGETVRQCIADKREKGYEKSGIGSCYMFRLDLQRIVDATVTGCMARFMNHCCRPNAYAKVITVDTDQGPEKKIVVFANKDIASGDEITYDYKFPIEDGSLKCTCGAPNCIGRMN